jgi:hypothetical protein
VVAKRTPDKGPTQAERLVMLFKGLAKLVRNSDDNEVFAVPFNGPNLAKPFAQVPAWLAAVFMQKYGKPPSNNAIQEAKRILQAMSWEAERQVLPIRTHMLEPYTILIDMGNDKGEVIEVTPRGWQVLARSPHPFKRTEATRPLFDPRLAKEGRIDGIRPLFNVNDRAWDFLVAWLVTAWVPMPGDGHIVLNLRGQQGTGKTMLATDLIELIDPSSGALTGNPYRREDLESHATGSWALGLENVTHIEGWVSDALSRMVTGDARRKRKLYTDSDVHIVTFQRVVVINGIEVTGMRLDLRSRAIGIKLQPIAGTKRKGRSSNDALLRREGPAVVRYLLDTLVGVLKAAKSGRYRLRELGRMADHHQWLKYVDVVRGTSAAADYLTKALDDTAIEAEEHVLSQRLHALLSEPSMRKDPPGPHRATWWLSQLGSGPSGSRPDGEWPTSAKAFTARLRMLSEGLSVAGWTIEEDQDGNSFTTWAITLPEE